MNVNPREIFETESVESMEDVKLGDVIACDSWSRGRVVVMTEADGEGPILFLADPDNRFADAPRKMTASEYGARSGWRRYPALSALWRKATGAKSL